jgi:hypothetical protein
MLRVVGVLSGGALLTDYFMLYCPDCGTSEARLPPDTIEMFVTSDTRKRTGRKRVSRVGGIVLDR